MPATWLRQSTDMLAVADEEVATALRFIRDNARHIIQVSDVVNATGLSHRTLHSRFRRVVGRSLVQEVNRQRALYIARLLTTTNEPIKRISQTFGYWSLAGMSRFFHREMGMYPRAYRLCIKARSERLLPKKTIARWRIAATDDNRQRLR